MIGAVVLAAGEGRRFGGAKVAAELDGRPLLEYVLQSTMAVLAIQRIVVVLGAHADEVTTAVDLSGVATVMSDRWQEGISASLRAGVKELAEAEAIIVMLGDQPFIKPEVIEAIAGKVHAPVPAARATYRGQPGHPVLIKRELYPAVARLRGDRGARGLLAAEGCEQVECGHLCSPIDIDTPSDLHAATRQLARVRQ